MYSLLIDEIVPRIYNMKARLEKNQKRKNTKKT